MDEIANERGKGLCGTEEGRGEEILILLSIWRTVVASETGNALIVLSLL